MPPPPSKTCAIYIMVKIVVIEQAGYVHEAPGKMAL
jgi:hypothetical protein